MQPVNGIRGHYQLAEADMTLREGLREYYTVNPGLSIPAEIDNPKSAAYFHNHDCTHVMFGTHTGPLDEGLNDLLTIFGVDISLRSYAGGFTATDESQKIVKEYVGTTKAKSFFLLAVRTLRLIPFAFRRARAMTRKWPWEPPESYLDRSLLDLREEFGIKVSRPEERLALKVENAISVTNRDSSMSEPIAS